MAKKLVEQDEAARFLGVTLDSLNSLRDRGKLYPKRDAGVWKYDQDDLERYQRELSEGSGLGNSWESLSLDDIPLEDNPGSVLLSEAELGESSPGAKSTIIGKGKNEKDSGESNLRLAAESGLRLADESDLKLKGGSGTNVGAGGGSDVPLEFGDSKLKLEGASPAGGSKAGSGLFDDEEFQLEPSGSSKTPSASSLSFSLENDDAISLGDSGDKKDDSGDTKKGKGGSGLMLADDDELDLGGHGSDITMNAGDSGIMLVDPADSGLALDKPLQLGGGNDELTIGEDDMITLEEQVDLEGATQLRSENDFNISASGGYDDDADSGSQVIALDSEEDLSGASMFGASSESLLTEDGGFGSPLGGTETIMAGAGLGTAPMLMASAAPPEVAVHAVQFHRLGRLRDVPDDRRHHGLRPVDADVELEQPVEIQQLDHGLAAGPVRRKAVRGAGGEGLEAGVRKDIGWQGSQRSAVPWHVGGVNDTNFVADEAESIEVTMKVRLGGRRRSTALLRKCFVQPPGTLEVELHAFAKHAVEASSGTAFGKGCPSCRYSAPRRRSLPRRTRRISRPRVAARSHAADRSCVAVCHGRAPLRRLRRGRSERRAVGERESRSQGAEGDPRTRNRRLPPPNRRPGRPPEPNRNRTRPHGRRRETAVRRKRRRGHGCIAY
ncbi:MAG: helix-turn-helix domain-containing protein [Pirellulales bacterium]